MNEDRSTRQRVSTSRYDLRAPKSLPPIPGEETKPGVAPPVPPITGIQEKPDLDLDSPTRTYGDKAKEEATLGIFPTLVFEADKVMAEPGDELPCLIIVDGMVDMALVLQDGKMRSIRMLLPGDMIGAAKLGDLHGVSVKSEFRYTAVAEGYAYVVTPEASVTFTVQQKNYLVTALAQEARYATETIVDLSRDRVELANTKEQNRRLASDVRKRFEDNRFLAQHLMEHRVAAKGFQNLIDSQEEEHYFDLIGSGQPFLINKGLHGMRKFLTLGL